MNVVVIDYGMCNLGSVRRAFEECGANVQVSPNPEDLKSADRIVLPGVGAYAKGMANLKEGGWITPLREAVEQGTPLLGICLGMQLLARRGFEGGEQEGLGFISGEVQKLTPTISDSRIPHIGWNEVVYKKNSLLFSNLPDQTDFYFVHSFHFVPEDTATIVAMTPYCGNFVSAISKGHIFGVQFHPEKSQKPGFQLIRNFLRELEC